jgi:MFS family permease
MYYYLFICLAIFGVGDLLGTLTKAKLSSVFVSLILFLIGFMTGILPPDIIELAGLTALGKWSSAFIIFHMGTMINMKELIDEWRTVLIAIISMIIAIISTMLVAPIIGKEAAIVSIPILNGGIVATQIMTGAALEKGLALAAALGTIIYAIQKFVGTPFASYFGLKEAELIVKNLRENKATISEAKNNEGQEKIKKTTFFGKYEKYYGNFVCLGITALFAWLSTVLGTIFPKVSYSIWALLLGAVVSFLGLVPEKILDRAKASGLLNMAVFASIIPSLASIKLADLATLGFQTAVIFIALFIAIYVLIGILPIWKIIGSKNVALGVSVAQLLGFPATYLISNEVANAVAENEEERQAILDVIMPRYVVAGLATVTSISIIMAGIFEKFL